MRSLRDPRLCSTQKQIELNRANKDVSGYRPKLNMAASCQPKFDIEDDMYLKQGNCISIRDDGTCEDITYGDCQECPVKEGDVVETIITTEHAAQRSPQTVARATHATVAVTLQLQSNI